MKTIIIGDLHGIGVWQLILQKESPQKVIFLGDYFDSPDIKIQQQISNFHQLIKYKESGQAEVILLMGNHDYHYLPFIETDDISGYNHEHEEELTQIMADHQHHFSIIHTFDQYLFTHAGVSDDFLIKAGIEYHKDTLSNEVTRVFKEQPQLFDYDEDCLDESGDDKEQSCIWIRPRSLMNNSSKIKSDYIQFAGHTMQKRVDHKGIATGGRFYFLDTLTTSGQYGVLEGDQLTFPSYK